MLAAILYALLADYATERKNNVLVLEGHNFEESIAHYERVLVEFYAPVSVDDHD